jgi:inner membrane protein
MDNLSHSVAGLAAGEIIHRLLPEEPDAERRNLRRRLLLVSCWLASNFPDLDIVLTPLLPAPLGYLLHHRGHTHTLLYALPQALLLWAAICLLWPAARRLLQKDTAARYGSMLAVSVGFALHILMDYLNSYGVHPFHPFDSRWFFGDMVFILEPVFWVAAGIPFAMTIGRRWLKGTLAALLVGLPLFFTANGFLLWSSLGVLVVLALALGAIQYKAGARGIAGLLLGALAGAGFVGMQGIASHEATRALAENLKGKDPDSRFLDGAMTPFPSNPLCWTFVSIESNESAGTYRMRRGLLSLAPDILPVAACPAGLSEPSLPKQTSAAIAYHHAEQGDLRRLRELGAANCHAEAWLRFARAPSLSGDALSDIRFSYSPRGNFTTMRLEDFRDRPCSRQVPRWDFPRADLLAPAARR